MMYLGLVVMILIGLMGAGSLIGMGDIVKKLDPIKGIVGIVALVLGVLGLLGIVSGGFTVSLGGIIAIASVAASLGLGVIFGAALIKQLTGSTALDDVVGKLKAFEVILGIVALVSAVYSILMIAGVLGGVSISTPAVVIPTP